MHWGHMSDGDWLYAQKLTGLEYQGRVLTAKVDEFA